MIKSPHVSLFLFPVLAAIVSAQPLVHVDPAVPSTPRPLQPQTEQAAIRDYLQSWASLQQALLQNRIDLLGEGFVGSAKNELARSIREQALSGVTVGYKAISHHITVLFYSPEGLSIELKDLVRYNVQVFDHGHLITSRKDSACYLVVLTPSQLRWSVRVMQAGRA